MIKLSPRVRFGLPRPYGGAVQYPSTYLTRTVSGTFGVCAKYLPFSTFLPKSTIIRAAPWPWRASWRQGSCLHQGRAVECQLWPRSERSGRDSLLPSRTTESSTFVCTRRRMNDSSACHHGVCFRCSCNELQLKTQASSGYFGKSPLLAARDVTAKRPIRIQYRIYLVRRGVASRVLYVSRDNNPSRRGLSHVRNARAVKGVPQPSNQ